MKNLPFKEDFFKKVFFTLKSGFELYKARVIKARVRHLEEIIVHTLWIEIDFRHIFTWFLNYHDTELRLTLTSTFFANSRFRETMSWTARKIENLQAGSSAANYLLRQKGAGRGRGAIDPLPQVLSNQLTLF